MRRESSDNPCGPGRLSILVAALLVALSVSLSAVLTGPASATNPQQSYDQARQKLDRIATSVDELRGQVAEDNRRVDELLGELSGLQVRADTLTEALDAKQAELDSMEAELEKGRKHLRLVRQRLQRALDTLRDQLVALYMSGTPDVAEMVLGSSDWSEIVTTAGYAESIQNRDEAVIQRVTTLREQIKAAVDRMKVQEEKLQGARDAIAVEQQAAVAARDQLMAQRADFLATRDMREQRIAALQGRAGTIEGSLPDLSVDPASSSAPSAPAPVSGQTAVLGSDGLAAAPSGAPQAVKDVIAAANAIVGMPYLWGGGHGSFESSGYDCSGAVSYALRGGRFVSSPMASSGYMNWKNRGRGRWITVYSNPGHAYMVVAGLRFDTSMTPGDGPGWSRSLRSTPGSFSARHPAPF